MLSECSPLDPKLIQSGHGPGPEAATPKLMSLLLLGDLNDYIQPTVGCVKPPEAGPKDPGALDKPVEINLNDCLACSGCITSAETVLVANQTHHQIYQFCQENAQRPAGERRLLFVSICAATRTALAQRHGLLPGSVHRRLMTFFKEHFDAAAVVDTTFASFIALKEAAEEFLEHHRGGESHRLPRLSSECPGWICYAEKRQPKLLPQICTVRSPQQIIGVLAKSYLLEAGLQRRAQRSLRRSDVFHVSVMSCYDKKLEASRDDFRDADGIRDVDCVITTGELLVMLQDQVQGRLADIPEAEVSASDPFRAWNTLYTPAGYYGGSGGSYLFYIMRVAAQRLFAIELPVNILADARIRVHHHRGNLDYTEYTLVRHPERGDAAAAAAATAAVSASPQPPLLRFAAIAGFRNIQTFVQKCKNHRLDYDYVEVMACPGACLFGGGQPPPGEEGGGEHLDKNQFRIEMEQLYLTHQIEGVEAALEELDKIYEWLEQEGPPDEMAVPRRSLLRTLYHPLESSTRKKPLINVQW